MFANPVFVTPGRYIENFERFDMHVFGEKIFGIQLYVEALP